MTGSKSAIVYPVSKSVRDGSGNTLLFSWADFVQTICTGPCCFVCGKHPREAKFNNEHIVPNWVLHRFKLHGEQITLPNGNKHNYGTYTIPCCEKCNLEMARIFEEPICALIEKGAAAIHEHIIEDGSLVLFTWMALIFLKSHLKDNDLRRFLDRRKGDEVIAADYVWEHMHHLHAVARAFHIEATIEAKAFGSMFVFPVRPDGTSDAFDMMTFTDAQTLYIRLGETGIVAVFDDACAALNEVGGLIEKIDGPLSAMQAREIAIHMALANMRLLNRPKFWTKVGTDGSVSIGGETDKIPRFEPFDVSVFGEAMQNAFPKLPSLAGYSPDEAAALLKAGKIGFLLDDAGNFIRDHAPSRAT